MAVETGPITLSDLKARLGIAPTDETDDADLMVIVGAVNAFASSLPVAQGMDGTPEHPWSSRVTFGTLLLGARLFRRRDSPAGVEGFGQDGAVYVRRNDPDIGLMLQLGDYAKPAVG